MTLLEKIRSYLPVSMQTLTENSANIFDILRPGDIAIDCGANIGNVTEKMAKQGVVVYAFEPNPYAYAKLFERFQHNPNVHCMNTAVSDHADTLKLYLHKNNKTDPIKWSAGSSLLAEKNNISLDHAIEVNVINLTEFIAGLQKTVRFLKIDIEGAECDVLNSLIDSGLAKSIASIVVETHEAKIPTLIQPMKLLRERIKKSALTNIKLNWI